MVEIARAAARALALVLLWAGVASAVVVPGGGSSRLDCLTVFEADANSPERKPRHIRCADGDPCDRDGTVNGVCEFAISVCANSTFSERCTAAGVQVITVRHALDNGDRKFDPDFQALQTRINSDIQPPAASPDVCTAPSTLRVPIKGPFAGGKCRKAKKLLKLDTVSTPSGGKIFSDRDRMRFICDPAPVGCDPQTLFTGTFDRIQRQIFDQGCAVSGCHDSQSRQGDLLLETGASHGNLVNQIPDNGPAAAQGWLRVTVAGPGSGDPDTSYLVRKVEGDFPGPSAGDFGARMPLGRPRLDPALRDVISRWVAAGAPTTGWVPGTD